MARLKRRLQEVTGVRVRSRAADRINDVAMLLVGATIGAMVMYILDANSGRRRRARARDKAVRILNDLQWYARRRGENLKNRALGSLAEMRSRAREAQTQVGDRVLEARSRAQLGHMLSHPGAVEVRAEDGCVIVSGPVLEGEREKILDRLNKTRGVRTIDLRVTEHSSSEGIPSLQGSPRMPRGQRVG